MTAVLTKRASEFMSDFDGALDSFITNGTVFNVDKLMSHHKLNNKDVVSLQTRLQPKADELEMAVIGGDDQLVEGYSNLDRASLRQLMEFYHTILEVSTSRQRKEKDEDDDESADRTYVSKRVAKIEVPTRECEAVFTVCKKYCAIRAFVGNVKITLNKVTADRVNEYKVSKEYDMENIRTMSKEDILKTIALEGREASRVSTTLAGKTIDFVVEF